MADKTIGDLNNAPGTVDDSNTLFVVQQAGAAYKLDGHAFILALTTILDGHGGISSIVYTPPVAPSLTGTMVITLADQSTTSVNIQNGNGIVSIAKASTSGLVDTYRITYNDNTTSTFTVTNGAKGDTGQAWYVWIRYAGQQPTSDADIGTTPDDWMGIYSGTASTAPTHYTQYQWFQIKGEKGDTGNTGASIQSITKTGGTGEPGTYDTYTVTLDNGTVAGTFTVYNGLNGTGSVNTVNGVQPDANGNVGIAASNVPSNGGSNVQSDITALTSLVVTAQSTANSKAAISDTTTTLTTTWSSNKIRNEIDSATPTGLVSYAEAQSLTDAQQAQARENIGANWTLLWQNASPTSEFGAQDITVTGLSDYPFVVAEFKTYKSDPAVTVNIVPYDAGGTRDYAVFAPFICQRVVTWTGNVVSFGVNWRFTKYNDYSTTTANDYLVPYKIYGFKQ